MTYRAVQTRKAYCRNWMHDHCNTHGGSGITISFIADVISGGIRGSGKDQIIARSNVIGPTGIIVPLGVCSGT